MGLVASQQWQDRMFREYAGKYTPYEAILREYPD
jgi:hypothetical protein